MEGNRLTGDRAEERLGEVSAPLLLAQVQHPQILHCLTHGVQAQGFPRIAVRSRVDQCGVTGWDEIIAVGVQIRIDMVIGILRVPEIISPVQKALNAVLPELNAKHAGVAQALCDHTPGDMVVAGGGAAIVDSKSRDVMDEERVGVVDRGNQAVFR